MPDGLGLHFSDLYPNMGMMDTNTKTVPDVDDKEALNEDVEVAEKASTSESSKKTIFLALIILVLMVIFLGAGG